MTSSLIRSTKNLSKRSKQRSYITMQVRSVNGTVTNFTSAFYSNIGLKDYATNVMAINKIAIEIIDI